MRRHWIALPALLVAAIATAAAPTDKPSAPTSKPATPWSSWRLSRGANPALQAVLDAQDEIRAGVAELTAKYPLYE